MKTRLAILVCVLVGSVCLSACSAPERHSDTGTLYPDASGGTGHGAGNAGAGTR